jgi:hypothetical protein
VAGASQPRLPPIPVVGIAVTGSARGAASNGGPYRGPEGRSSAEAVGLGDPGAGGELCNAPRGGSKRGGTLRRRPIGVLWIGVSLLVVILATVMRAVGSPLPHMSAVLAIVALMMVAIFWSNSERSRRTKARLAVVQFTALAILTFSAFLDSWEEVAVTAAGMVVWLAGLKYLVPPTRGSSR